MTNSLNLFTLNLPGASPLFHAFLDSTRRLFTQEKRSPSAVHETPMLLPSVRESAINILVSLSSVSGHFAAIGSSLLYHDSLSFPDYEFQQANNIAAIMQPISWNDIRARLRDTFFQLIAQEKTTNQQEKVGSHSTLLYGLAVMALFDHTHGERGDDWHQQFDEYLGCFLDHLYLGNVSIILASCTCLSMFSQDESIANDLEGVRNKDYFGYHDCRKR
jgi:hypothetical protein